MQLNQRIACFVVITLVALPLMGCSTQTDKPQALDQMYDMTKPRQSCPVITLDKNRDNLILKQSVTQKKRLVARLDIAQTQCEWQKDFILVKSQLHGFAQQINKVQLADNVHIPLKYFIDIQVNNNQNKDKLQSKTIRDIILNKTSKYDLTGFTDIVLYLPLEHYQNSEVTIIIGFEDEKKVTKIY